MREDKFGVTVVSTKDIVKTMVKKTKQGTTKETLTESQCRLAIRMLREVVSEEIVKGNKVNIPGFFTMYAFIRPGRKAFNFRTNSQQILEDAVSISTKVGNTLKVDIRANSEELKELLYKRIEAKKKATN